MKRTAEFILALVAIGLAVVAIPLFVAACAVLILVYLIAAIAGG